MKIRPLLTRPAVLNLGLGLALLALTPFAAAQNQIFDSRSLAPFVPTPEKVVEQMLQAADVQADDLVYDIGSGDGRILFAAAKDFHADAVGVEINALLARQTVERARELGLDDKVRVIQKDVFEVDLSPATVVTVYLLSSSNEKLKPKLEADLAEGARVVSHDFQFRGWTPEKTVEVTGHTPRTHRVYVYRIGSHKTGSQETNP